MVGKQVQQYQFLEKLGSGGMGEIYKALDTRLNRPVAVKVLPSASSGDPERRRRFIQEAQAASTLNHPSIVTIHDIITDGDTEYMVMEFVAGKTLNDIIPKGGLRVPQALKYALQISDALSAAHTAGIIHRDLKPANVMVTDSGIAKILDFGLAKLTDRGSTDLNSTQAMGAQPLTMEGTILGTVSYMSPEQAQGLKIDPRSDIFSYGTVLYEMVTGRRAFEGESSLSTLSAILRDEPPDMADVAPDVPAQMESVILRCLRKSPDERFQSMKDVQNALSVLKRDSDSGSLYTSRLVTESQLRATPPVSSSRTGMAKPPSRSGLPPASAPAAKKGLSPAMAIGIGALAALLVGGVVVGRMVMNKRADEAAALKAKVDADEQARVEAEAAAARAAEVAAAHANSLLDNNGIVDMWQNKVAPDLILSQIRAAPETKFDFSTAEIIRLSKAGVPSYIVDQMRDPMRLITAPLAQSQFASNLNRNTKQLPPPSTPSGASVPAPAPVVTTPVPAPVPSTPAPAASTPAPAPVPNTPAPAPTVATVAATMTDAQPFTIVLSAELRNDAMIGQALQFTTKDDVKDKDGKIIVLPKGTIVRGEVTETPKKKMFGIGGGKMSFKLTRAEASNGIRVNLRTLSARRGDGVTQRPAETNRSGTNKDIAAAQGTEYVAYVDGEQHVTVPAR